MRTKIVPVEPSELMIEAGLAEIGRNPDLPDEEVCAIYEDMLDVAPPVSEELVERVARIIEPSAFDPGGYPGLAAGARRRARGVLALINGESDA